MKKDHLPPTALIIASSVEPAAFSFSASLQGFLKSSQLDALTPQIVQVTRATERTMEKERLRMELARVASKKTNPATLIFTSPAAIDMLVCNQRDQLNLHILQIITSLSDRLEMAGVGATTVTKIQGQWGTSGITIRSPAAAEGLRPCLELIGKRGALKNRSVLILGAADGISQRITTEMIARECFFSVYQNVALEDVAQRLLNSVQDTSKTRQYCACVCQSGAAVRAIVQSFEKEDENTLANANEGTKIILYPRGASANLALQKCRLPAALLSCEDIPGSERGPNDGNPRNT